MPAPNLDDMTEPELHQVLMRAALAIKTILPPDSGFVLLASPFNGKIAQYISNVQREDAATWMLQTVARWRTGDFVPRTGE